MIPRAVRMTKEVTRIGVPTSQGNILFNGTITTVANTTGQLAWQWPQTTTAPIPLPNVDLWAPALRSWQDNSKQYFTSGGASLVGYSTAFYYWSPSFQTNGSPRWASRPNRKYTSQRVTYLANGPDGTWTSSYVAPVAPSSAAMYPVADSNTAPPIGAVVWP
jgi:hypothetical protein